MGPVEYLVVAFPGNKFNGDIVPALAELTDKGIIHIIDLVFIRKDAEGNVVSAELEDLPADVAAAILMILEAPPHVEIGDILMRSGDQAQ